MNSKPIVDTCISDFIKHIVGVKGYNYKETKPLDFNDIPANHIIKVVNEYFAQVKGVYDEFSGN
jgi:hypothetical protein